MNTALTEAIKEAYATAPTGVTYLETIQITHPSVSGSVFLVKDRQNHDLTLEDDSVETFTACPFRLALPPSGSNGLQELTLEIDNVDSRISDFIKEAKEFLEEVVVTYRPYLSTDPTTPQMDPPLVLFLTDINVGVITVTGKATFADIINRKFPNESYTRSRFPSLGN